MITATKEESSDDEEEHYMKPRSGIPKEFENMSYDEVKVRLVFKLTNFSVVNLLLVFCYVYKLFQVMRKNSKGV